MSKTSEQETIQTFNCDEQGCKGLTEAFEQVQARFNASERLDKEYVRSYMHLKELVRFFCSKLGASYTAKLVTTESEHMTKYSLALYNGQGEDVMDCIFCCY